MYDALVVGGGLAGSALAIMLAEAGRCVLLIEKSAAAHPKMCGEFLSHEALHYLLMLGIDVAELGAVPIKSVRLGRQRMIASAALPFPAMSISRERLDEALLQLAIGKGVCVLRKRRARSLAFDGGHWSVGTDGGETFSGQDGFLATGKHDLHGWNRSPGKQNDLIAFKMYWRLTSGEQSALERHVELILFPGGYAGLQLVEEGRANLCLLLRRTSFRKVGGTWPALLAHMQGHSAHLATRLAGATPCWERPLSLSSIPYGYVRKFADEGLWRLGDQSAVIPSFAGDGMSIALHSARLAGTMYLKGKKSNEYQQRLAQDLRRQVGLATILSRTLVSSPGRAALGMLARLWPGALPIVAGSTRIETKNLVQRS